MKIFLQGDTDCARRLDGLLRRAGFAVTRNDLFWDYAVRIEESASPHAQVAQANGSAAEAADTRIHFDSVDCELERRILQHVTALSPHAVVVDRPGGEVHSDREIRIVVPRGNEAQAHAVAFGVVRGLIDLAGKRPWYRKLFAKDKL